MEKQAISRIIPIRFKLTHLVVACLAAFVTQLEANINVPPTSALTISGGHVVVNDDDTNKNEIGDKTEELTIDNKGLEGPKTPEKSEPVLRKFSITAKWADCPGILTINSIIPDANIKLWKDASRSEPFTFDDAYAVTASPGKTVTFWVEGITPTDTFDAIKFTAVYTVTNPTTSLSATATGTIAFGVTQADLDIDSDNQNGTEATGYDDTEDQIEFSFKEEHPGKIILETRNDMDSDGVIDSVDGIVELTGTGGTPTVAGLKLIPMRLTLDKPFDPKTAKVKFSYRASVPRLGEGIAANGQDAEGNTLYRITTPGMRLWIKDGDARTSGKDVGTTGGDFIPANTEINWQDLQPESGATTKFIYLEYVDVEGSDKQFSKEDIVVEITDDTSAAKGYIMYGEDAEKKQPLPGNISPDGVNATLLQIDIIPDYNRDGKIDDNDRGKVTKGNPYRFWVNDDDDIADEYRKKDGKDIPNLSENDSSNASVDGIRDLVDFFPLHLDLRSALKVFPKEEYVYYLNHSESAFNYFHNPGAVLDDPTGKESSNAYLRISNTAEAFKNISLSGTEGRDNLYYSFLDAAESGQGVILLDAIKKTTKPIVLEIHKKSSSEATVKFEFHVETSSVEDMYRHINLRSASGGTGGRETDVSEPKNYPDDMPELASDKYFVLVHGYNVNGEQARGWHAEFFKRMWWSGSKAKFIGVSWHGEESQGGAGMTSMVKDHIPDSLTPNYHANVINAFQTADNLASSLKDLSGEISIAAHSLGNMVVGLAIQDHGLNVENYFLVDAAVAMEAYNAGEVKQPNMTNGEWKDYDESLWASEWHKLAWQENDPRKKLTWRGRLGEVVSKTNTYNFYSSEEEVLSNAKPSHSSTLLGAITDDLVLDILVEGVTIGEHTWVLQEILKGKGISGELLGSTYGGWKFNFINSQKSGLDGTPNPSVDGTYHIWVPTAFITFPPTYVTRILKPDEVASVASLSGDFMNQPFFWIKDEHMGIDLDANLLAQAFPARTNPAGSNPVGIFDAPSESRNYDMAVLKNGSYSENENHSRWLHSDIRDLGYLYTFKIYDKFREIGELNQ